jgi:dihydrofolate reductase
MSSRKLTAFNQVSLDGYFADASGDMRWAHKSDPEWTQFTAENARGGGALVFGRRTYDLMASFWPTPMAAQANPVVAERMNAMPKIVFSRTLEAASWNNTTIVKGDVAAEIRRLKSEPGPNMAIMGSGTIVSAAAQAGLVDELQIVVNPLVLGKGRSLFEAVTERFALRLVKTRAFENGNVVLTYAPA